MAVVAQQRPPSVERCDEPSAHVDGEVGVGGGGERRIDTRRLVAPPIGSLEQVLRHAVGDQQLSALCVIPPEVVGHVPAHCARALCRAVVIESRSLRVAPREDAGDAALLRG